ncbi:MAG: septum formation inhibitor Maf [Gammaproteobacteria bacterium]|nr:septum formation inhibitor Maf [Gammaproteobacteria bacterium]
MLYLASASPRRTELLTQLGIEHQVMVADVPEIRAPDETALAYGYRVSFAKAEAVAQGLPSSAWVLSADTEVILNDDTLGKPQDKAHFMRMMRALSGVTHAVQTVICLRHGDSCWQNHQLSLLSFRLLTDSELGRYWSSGEPLGKAGGYAIQGRAQAWVSQFQGSYSGVMGLPLNETEALLTLAGYLS